MFLGEPPPNDVAEATFAEDREEDGYVHNYSRLWAWRPGLWDSFGSLRSELMDPSTLTDREWALLVTAAVSQHGDSYCSLAWGPRLAGLTDDDTAAQVLADQPAPALSEREAALVAWARQVARDPNGTTPEDVSRLRQAGLDDREVFEATAFIAFRLAMATVNDALGAVPDRQMADAAPARVRDVVTYGRTPAAEPSPA
jgi:uncharacterized peroxidase-related enzyme